MKVLFVASVYRHLTSFHIPFMKYFQDEGYEVYAAGIGDEDKKILEANDVKCIDISFSRNPFSLDNVKAYYQLKNLFKKMNFDLVHVHTPVAAFLTRAAYKKSKNGKMVYTAHGFHFYRGAPLFNWLLYYPLERIAASWTDHLITINNEDYLMAQKFISKNKVSLTHGVGVKPNKDIMSDEEKLSFRKKLGLKEESIVISYIAELNNNKNQKYLLENWSNIKQKNPKYELLIIGTGVKGDEIKELVHTLNLTDIHFLGFRRDVPKILKITDIVTLLSFREGLPKSIMEAMIEGIPCVVSDTRGMRDLIKNNHNGFVVSLSNKEDLCIAFDALYNKTNRLEMGNNSEKHSNYYLEEQVLEEYILIYTTLLNEKDKFK